MAESLLDGFEQAELQAQDIETTLDKALAELTTPHTIYMSSTPLERRLLNQTFFKRILIGEESEVLGTTLTPVYEALAAWEEDLGQPRARKSRSANPDPDFRGQGLHVEPMVETVGIEPTSAVA